MVEWVGDGWMDRRLHEWMVRWIKWMVGWTYGCVWMAGWINDGWIKCRV